jgi:hypothetical protein
MELKQVYDRNKALDEQVIIGLLFEREAVANFEQELLIKEARVGLYEQYGLVPGYRVV